MKIDPNKKYRYRGGGLARILCVDAPGDYPVVTIDDSGNVQTHTEKGWQLNSDCEMYGDLIEVREPREFRLWVAENGDTATPARKTDTLPQRSIDAGWREIRVREIID